VYWVHCRAYNGANHVTPAMEAGLANHIWGLEELCGLLPETASATKRIDRALILKAFGEQAS
jgi:hypothetical protein